MKKGKNMEWVLGIISFLFILGSPFTGNADSGDFFSRFHPSITVIEEYDDNIFLTNKNKENDFITTVNAGLRFSALEEKTYGIDLNFVGGFVYYAKHHGFNYFSPSGTVNAWYAIAQNLTFRVRDNLVRSDSSREQIYIADALPNQFLLPTVRGERAIYIRNVVEPSVEYRFGKEDLFSVLYRNNIYRNQNILFEDSQENTISPKLIYWFNIRNGVTLDYSLTLGNYERSPDQMTQGARGRYTYRFNPKTSIFGEYSFERQHFKSPGVDYDVHNPSLGIEHKFSPTLSGSAQGGYFWQIPNQGSKMKGLSYNLNLTKSAKRTNYTLSFQGGYTEDYFTAQNLGFTKYYRAYGTINHQMTEKMTVGLTGSLERATHGSDRKDWIWGIWGNASYAPLRWLTVSLVPSYTECHSAVDIFNYRDYRGMFKITAAF